MKRWSQWLRARVAAPWAVRAALVVAAAAMALALAAPRPVLPRRVFDGIVVLDITQSMSTIDQVVDGQPASRLAFARARLHRALARLPCGARLGWGVFTEYRTAVLLLPLEVCANYAELSAALDRIDNTMAWAGGSQISKGLLSALRSAARIPEHPAVVFLTDGHEAPPLRADYVPQIPDDAIDRHGFVIGVGGDEPRPIPKTDPTGHPIGVWGPQEVIQAAPLEPWEAPPQPEPGGNAPVTGTEHLSSLKEAHLRELAALTGLGYVRLQASTDVASILQDDRASRRLATPTDVRAPLAALALALLVFAVGPVRRLPRSVSRT